ncbi:fumarylacetoacetate hydrolase family protein [Flavobacteriaceae bacterium]|nr:fumarylacetoacetate hydrolase family protein [Flavobacteriaceae bacterium]MDA8948840.1 fumarylacetoacetate hydrolase family protein [Flavobacteriaceae bacterium]MDA9016312.1 fumarylacetoacetate hydrolase family protein [Flavobacteriaceae bacterium]MDA9572343.1 fumarylacetoacetate hydrolase family protein [Flavobacteriaceae bacterium]MDB3862585.1 fumarylacetoacetate hydrolase family protein [Flavobacteriaceae bacterium]
MKIICVGRNYTAHIEELENERPEHPVLFIKPDTSILQKKQPFFIPHFSDDIHYEVEVMVKIDRIGKHIEPEFAPKYYSQVGLGIDFTARSLQNDLKAKGLPWEKAKAFDGSALLGDWFDKKQFTDLNSLSFLLEKNGTLVQEGNTAQMLWKIDELIAYCSQFFTLKIGDVLFTGTPSGVGVLKDGDVLKGFLESSEAFSVKIK